MTDGFLRPRWLEREFAEIHERWRPLREAVARDWDRVLGTGPTPVAFRLAEKVVERMVGPTIAERAAALVPLVRQAAEAERPTFRVDDQPSYRRFSTKNERWINHQPPATGDAPTEHVSWQNIVDMYRQMLPRATSLADAQYEYDRWAQGCTSPDYLPDPPKDQP